MPTAKMQAARRAPGYTSAHLLAGAGGNLNTQSPPIMKTGKAGLFS
jgi:hypothetical protein